VVWIVPEPATNHILYAVVNPAGMAAEFTTTNNTQWVYVGGTDLAVSLLLRQTETSGALRIIAQVQNLGAPTATNTVLSIRRVDSTGTNVIEPPLAIADVASLEPGRLAQVLLELPAGTQPEGDAFYQLHADETGLIADVDTYNNTTTFSVNLWRDADSDGIPDGWMTACFGHSTGLENDLSRAPDDPDGDGVSNLAEYLAGTDPKDAHSYLRMTSINDTGASGLQIAWGSSANRLYSIQRASAIAQGGVGFTNLAEHVLSTPPENVYLDLTATNGMSFFYRVKVE
jgi:hypothetical protein